MTTETYCITWHVIQINIVTLLLFLFLKKIASANLQHTGRATEPVSTADVQGTAHLRDTWLVLCSFSWTWHTSKLGVDLHVASPHLKGSNYNHEIIKEVNKWNHCQWILFTIQNRTARTQEARPQSVYFVCLFCWLLFIYQNSITWLIRPGFTVRVWGNLLVTPPGNEWTVSLYNVKYSTSICALWSTFVREQPSHTDQSPKGPHLQFTGCWQLEGKDITKLLNSHL